MNIHVRRIVRSFGILVAVLIVIGLVLFILKPKAPKPSFSLSHISEMEAYFEQVVAAERPPGLSVAVVKDGEMAYSQGFGFADASKNTPARKETVYHWWSMTKIPTAVAVLQLQERGFLEIDDPVAEHLPSFQVTYEGEHAVVSIRQVIGHTAGLSNAAPEIFTWIHMEGEPPVNQTELFISKHPEYDDLLFLPGEKTKYSNWGYVVLGALIEAVTGQSYEEYVIDNILLPLDMQDTNFVYTKTMAENEATGSQHLVDLYTPFFPLLKLNYIIKERVSLRYWFHRVYNDQTPPTGLIGPVTDIALFMMAYLDGGGSILGPESVSLMNGQLKQLAHPGESTQGLGWRAYLTDSGRRYLAHRGGGPGFATIMRVYPEEQLGVVVMGNDSSIDREVLADVLADMEW